MYCIKYNINNELNVELMLKKSNFSKVNIPNTLLNEAKKHCGNDDDKLFLNMTRFSEQAFRKLLQELQEKN